MTTARYAGFAAALLLGLAAAAPARAQVRCGDVIGPNQTVTLQDDLEGCGPGAAAITVIGPATLDLNGFSVICASSGSNRPTGIVVVGRKATVRNGSVQHCGRGVHVVGEGGHRIEGITAALSSGGSGPFGEGFVIESDANRLTGNSAVQNQAEGFRIVTSDRNRLVGNNSFFNSFGFVVLIGQRNVLEGNRAGDNEIFGFFLDGGPFTPGGSRNLLKGNRATGNSTGIYVDSEEASRVQLNEVSGSDQNGIFVVVSRKTRVIGNRSEDNGESGIVVLASNDTLVTRNTSLNNDRADDDVRTFDMLDSSADCGTSRWAGNVFVTANEPCIR